MSGMTAMIVSTLSGVLFGVAMAPYYHIRARQYNLPSWAEIKASV
ncbi:putative membrane protein [Collimonas arenae]|uniref:Putative membrane protein n=1 Tax=Collimonas arenae TaxID=279058 RepID=A0A127PPA6_9BURK|nr:putative membrane protein [Collimonas arenae]AMP09496.1 putative membrane protein [Collimonas arenae]